MSKNNTTKYAGKIIEGEGEVRPHAMLVTGASMFLKNAKTISEGKSYFLMASMLFCAFSLESYLSHLGRLSLNND